MKQITPTDAIDFKNYFSEKYPELRAKFPDNMTFITIGDGFGVIQPKTVNDDEYLEYKRIEYLWLDDSGFIDNSDKTMIVLIGTKNEIARCPIDSIVDMVKINDNETKVTIREITGTLKEYNINESIESIKQRMNMD